MTTRPTRTQGLAALHQYQEGLDAQSETAWQFKCFMVSYGDGEDAPCAIWRRAATPYEGAVAYSASLMRDAGR
jgi:hypothetical protein